MERRATTALERQSLFEMLDVELASQMTRVQGFGFTKQMLDANSRRLVRVPGWVD